MKVLIVGGGNLGYYLAKNLLENGDKVKIMDGVLYINGTESGWITEKILEPGIAENEFTLQSGEYFCIGDNPNNSEDSRFANIGNVKKDYIVGKAWFRFVGITDMGKIR